MQQLHSDADFHRIMDGAVRKQYVLCVTGGVMSDVVDGDDGVEAVAVEDLRRIHNINKNKIKSPWFVCQSQSQWVK